MMTLSLLVFLVLDTKIFLSKNLIVTSVIILIIVPIMAKSNIPAPHAIPIAADINNVAAVVNPKTVAPCLKTVPPPIKPIPVTTWAATRAVSRVPYSAAVTVIAGKPYIEIIVNTQAPKHTKIFVLKPAYLFVISLSKPMAKPSNKAETTLINIVKSKFNTKELFRVFDHCGGKCFNVLAPCFCHDLYSMDHIF